ncbi:hypothetical protein K7432_002859 [Basidiobolus ranarum]|uniref:DUF3020 domain-containing protein n=1 Tax=Basidiobolus ranarum TaxID=34480 RepID=A0ABR2W732_9FUNG
MTILEENPQLQYLVESSVERQVRAKGLDEAMTEKLRRENRERKKKWREQNEDRNKDNDLRCRVNKRAQKLFGSEESEEKQRWIQDEFNKRQLKRKEKEQRRVSIFAESPITLDKSVISTHKPYAPYTPHTSPHSTPYTPPPTIYTYSQHNVLPPMVKKHSRNITLPPMVNTDQYNSDYPIDAVLSLMELNGAIHNAPNVASH